MIIEHPNRAKASSKSSRAFMVLLLLGSAGLIGLIVIGGWSALMGMKLIAIAWVLLYLLFAYYVARWNRGVLPVVAALSIIMLIFAVIAVPTWVDRDSASYASSALSAGLLATLTAILVALQAVRVRRRDARVQPAVERRGRALPGGRAGLRPARHLSASACSAA